LTDLSRKYIYIVTADKSKNEYGGSQTTKITVEIIRKSDNRSIETLSIKPGDFSDSFSDCSLVSSHVTRKHSKDEGDDNDWGDFIVADFNFDGQEDFAVKEDSHNTGATYDFFIQNRNGRFVTDSFLSGYFFPYKIDRKNKTLTTATAVTTGGYQETVVKYNPRTKKWRVLRSVHRKAY
jgi:hypothetical protein